MADELSPVEEPTVRREIDLPLEGDELWSLIADGEAWEGWLGDDVDLAVEPGATGSVVDDDGVERTVSIERVDDGERVEFVWWPTAEPERRSRVDLVVVPRPDGSSLRITETFLPGPTLVCSARAREAMARADLHWGIRFASLWCAAHAPARV
jgi:uncharacterized protein YndB with AHSA1/START domain